MPAVLKEKNGTFYPIWRPEPNYSWNLRETRQLHQHGANRSRPLDRRCGSLIHVPHHRSVPADRRSSEPSSFQVQHRTVTTGPLLAFVLAHVRRRCSLLAPVVSSRFWRAAALSFEIPSPGAFEPLPSPRSHCAPLRVCCSDGSSAGVANTCAHSCEETRLSHFDQGHARPHSLLCSQSANRPAPGLQASSSQGRGLDNAARRRRRRTRD